MNRIRRLAAVLAGLAGALLAFAAAAPPALASTAAVRAWPPWADPPLPPGWHPPPGQVVHAGFGGMPGWQVALIAAAALLAPAIAVLWDRVPAARRNPVTGAPSARRVPSSPRVTSRPAAPGQPPAGPALPAGHKHPSQGGR